MTRSVSIEAAGNAQAAAAFDFTLLADSVQHRKFGVSCASCIQVWMETRRRLLSANEQPRHDLLCFEQAGGLCGDLPPQGVGVGIRGSNERLERCFGQHRLAHQFGPRTGHLIGDVRSVGMGHQVYGGDDPLDKGCEVLHVLAQGEVVALAILLLSIEAPRARRHDAVLARALGRLPLPCQAAVVAHHACDHDHQWGHCLD